MCGGEGGGGGGGVHIIHNQPTRNSPGQIYLYLCYMVNLHYKKHSPLWLDFEQYLIGTLLLT